MTIENLNSRAGQSAKMQNYMLQTQLPDTSCGVMDGVYCKSYSPATNIDVESALIQGEISKAIERPVPAKFTGSASNNHTAARASLAPVEAKEHKSVKSEQTLLNRINPDILPSRFTNTIPRNELFGMDTRSVIKYS
tara:strand:- start:9802 stop:10212 length:411 start_codon:yes stop_codon:yes gene_type:complete